MTQLDDADWFFFYHTGHPAWAQNDAMMGAYMDDMAYYYRVNDDTVLETGSWTEKMIEQLLRSEPANVGVAGPWFKEGSKPFKFLALIFLRSVRMF